MDQLYTWLTRPYDVVLIPVATLAALGALLGGLLAAREATKARKAAGLAGGEPFR
jgi:hypothetical protein